MAVNPALAMLAIQSAPLAIGTLQQLFGELRKPTAEEMAAPLPESRMQVAPEGYARPNPYTNALPEYYNPHLRR